MKYIMAILILLSSFPAFAKQKPFPMSASAVIEVDLWDPATQTYELTLLEAPGQGPLIATPEEMARTIKALNLDKIKRNPTSIVKNQYKTDKVMMLLPPDLVEARKAKLSGKKEKNP